MNVTKEVIVIMMYLLFCVLLVYKTNMNLSGFWVLWALCFSHVCMLILCLLVPCLSCKLFSVSASVTLDLTSLFYLLLIYLWLDLSFRSSWGAFGLLILFFFFFTLNNLSPCFSLAICSCVSITKACKSLSVFC